MTTFQNTPAPAAKKCTFYINGNRSFAGKRVVLNKRTYRTLDATYDFLTNTLKTGLPVRSICTPQGGTRVDSLDTFEENGNYVAVLNNRFKKLNYLNLVDPSVRKPNQTPRNPEVRPVEHSRIQVSARIRKVPVDVVTIYVYANGKVLEPARRVTITHQLMKNWYGILDVISDKTHLDTGACRKLYTMDGTQVLAPTELATNQFYVAVGAEVGGFKKNLEYGIQRPLFGNTQRRHSYFSSPQDTLWGFKGYRKKNRRLGKDGSLPPLPRRGAAGRKSHTGVVETSSPMSTSSDKTDKTNKTHPRRSKPKKEEDEVFHYKPVKHKRSSEKQRKPAEDEEEGGVFKAKGSRTETQDAQEVEDSKDTKVDLPIDQVEAEEVQEEDEEAELSSSDHDIAIESLTKRPSDELQGEDLMAQYDKAMEKSQLKSGPTNNKEITTVLGGKQAPPKL